MSVILLCLLSLIENVPKIDDLISFEYAFDLSYFPYNLFMNTILEDSLSLKLDVDLNLFCADLKICDHYSIYSMLCYSLSIHIGYYFCNCQAFGSNGVQISVNNKN